MDIDATILALVNSDSSRGGKRKRESRSDLRYSTVSSAVPSFSTFSLNRDDTTHADDDYVEDDEKEFERSLYEKFPDWNEMKKWDKRDLMGDHPDRNRLMQMSELERESVLAERRARLEQVEEHQAIYRRIQERNRNEASRRKSSVTEEKRRRPLTEKERRGEQLASLKKERDRKSARAANQAEEPQSRSRRSSYSQSETSDMELDDDRQRFKVSVKERKSDRKTEDKPFSQPMTIEEIRSIQLKRSDIERFLHADFFDSTVTGAFLRLGLGLDPHSKERVYRVCQIDGLKPYHKAYQLTKGWCNLAFNAKHGAAKRTFTFEVSSNEPITDREYDRWVRQMDEDKEAYPEPSFIREKQKEITAAREHVFTPEEVETIIQRKQEIQRLPANPAVRLVQLEADVQKYESLRDTEKVRELRERIDEIKRLVYAEDEPQKVVVVKKRAPFGLKKDETVLVKSEAGVGANGRDKGKGKAVVSALTDTKKESLGPLTDLSSIPALTLALKRFEGQSVDEILSVVAAGL
ncbi:RNA polymerase-associated protein rtf1 [Rhizophlyctis rosea]|uniref:RNA polymerase-associated protein rtf1 n=1 Tax=Rhizophlyctis rosea TaxID=64517 RepID=A0AAD5X7Y2_9FUNG|nr:RNA polymerase-associated protein rtf1 [Rhizophlyctis rosea]